MSNSVSLLFVSIFAIIIMFFVPSYQMAQKQDDLAHQLVYTETVKFVDAVRTKGYVTAEMLEEYQSKIEVGSYIYRIDMVHEKKMYTPIYTTPQDITSFTGEYEVQYDEFHTKQINDFLYNNPATETRYKMSAGDFFNVEVKNLNKTQANILLDFFQGVTGGDTPTIVVPYGGLILNENY